MPPRRFRKTGTFVLIFAGILLAAVAVWFMVMGSASDRDAIRAALENGRRAFNNGDWATLAGHVHPPDQQPHVIKRLESGARLFRVPEPMEVLHLQVSGDRASCTVVFTVQARVMRQNEWQERRELDFIKIDGRWYVHAGEREGRLIPW